MEKIVRFALAAIFLLGIASAQNAPSIDVFGGYSYLDFNVPASQQTFSQQLKMNGWNASASWTFFHHLGAEFDLSGHQVNNCGGSTLKCDNFSYMFGPRYTIGDHSRKLTGFVHGLIGQDRADVIGQNGSSSSTISDTSVSMAAGGGADYWLFRHVGIQFGPVDYLYARHFNNFGAANQSNFRASGGIALRFGGDIPEPEPKAPKEPKEKSEGGHRSWIRPWHKSKPETAEGQPADQPPAKPAHKKAAPAPEAPSTPSRGMSIHPLGIVAAPQEFDGAKILSIEPGSVAEMASLHVGDLVKSVDGKAVRTPMELAAELSDKTGKVRIGILRGTWATETEIVLSH